MSRSATSIEEAVAQTADRALERLAAAPASRP